MSKNYVNSETTLYFSPAAATQNDVTLEVDGLTSGSGHQSEQHDFGTGARAFLFEWRAFVQFAAAPALNTLVRIYLKTAGSSTDATEHPDNSDGTTDGAVSSEDKLRNLHYLGSIEPDQASANVEMVASGLVEIRARAIQVVFWNGTGVALTTDVNENGLSLTPVPDEAQP